jgi:hypothetical protein
MIRFTAILAGLLALVPRLPAGPGGEGADAPAAAAPAAARPAVERTGEHSFKIGLIEFDSRTRELRFPAWVNMHQGMIEFPVVHRNGRTHEAIFATDALPLHLETALRLLRYKPSKEVFPQHPTIDFDNPPPYEEWPPPVYDPPEPAAHVQVFAVWNNAAGQAREVDIRKMLRRATLDEQGEEGPEIRFESVANHWVYTGSTEKMETVVEPLGGCIVGIRTEPESCFNTGRDDQIHAGEWFADPKVVPAPETPVTILIRPLHPAAPAQPTAQP